LTLKAVGNLGSLYSDQGKLVEVEAMYQRALVGLEKTFGSEHTSALVMIVNLGNLYSDQGKLAEAEAMYQRALVGYEKTLGTEHMSTLDTVGNLGNLYLNQGKLIEADAMYQRALAGKEKALGPEHISTLNTVGNLGNLHYKRGKLAEAEAMYQRALVGKEKALGPEHISTLNTVGNLGCLYRNQGRLAEAEAMCQWGLAGYEKAPPHTVITNPPHQLKTVSTGLPNFKYTLLPPGNYIRLLEITSESGRLPGSTSSCEGFDKDDVVAVRLHVTDLDQPELYDALSYTWGNPQSVFRNKSDAERAEKKYAGKVPILCNGKLLRVGVSLHEALEALRQAHRKQARPGVTLQTTHPDLDARPLVRKFI
jgi:tetratricopeptide (TPR) repeat protein